MLKHVAIIGVSVISALASAQGVVALAEARAAAQRPAVTASAQVQAQAQSMAAVAIAPIAEAPAQIAKASDGHYWAQASVNGRWVKFLVDTGASTVALTAADATRLGFNLAALTYDHPVVTAAGPTSAASVTLDVVSVAGARVDQVQALVLREGLATSLLGMSYLGRLSRFEATQTALILRP